MDTLYIVMPAYNEGDNIEEVIKQWYLVLENKSEDSRLVVADSGSIDDTHEKLENLKKVYPKLHILDTSNQFHGPKVIALYDYAIKKGADYIFQTDSDGQTNPEEFEEFWKLRKAFDGVFGNRTNRLDGKGRAFVEKVVCFLLRLYFGVIVPDANAPFRLMKAEIVKKYLYDMPSDYLLPNIMMTTFFLYFKERTAFVKISFKPREKGTNSINYFKIIRIGWQSLHDFRYFRMKMKNRDI